MQTVLSLLKMKANAQKLVISFACISSETQNLQPIFLRIYDTKVIAPDVPRGDCGNWE